MKLYIAALAAGLLAGILYGVLNVRSPAPPVVALVGLLGILLGEQIPPLVRQLLQPKTSSVAWFGQQMFEQQIKPHCFGELPRGADAANDHHGNQS